MSLFPDQDFARKAAEPSVWMDIAAEVKEDTITHYLVLRLPVRHGPFQGWGKEREAPEYPEGMFLAQRVASVLPKRLGDRLRRVLEEGYSPMKSMRLRNKDGGAKEYPRRGSVE